MYIVKIRPRTNLFDVGRNTLHKHFMFSVVWFTDPRTGSLWRSKVARVKTGECRGRSQTTPTKDFTGNLSTGMYQDTYVKCPSRPGRHDDWSGHYGTSLQDGYKVLSILENG